MRRTVLIAGVVASLGATAVPAQAGVRGDLRHAAKTVRAEVDHKLGPNAGGRRIERVGVLVHGHARPATVSELRAYIGTLHRLIAPPAPAPAPASSIAATPQPQTAVAASAPISSPSSSPRYCGAYQFDQQTWQSVGMSGSACGASPAVQDEAARRLMRQRGTQPWPNCGSTDLAAIRQCENSGSYG